MYGKVFASMYDGTLYGHWKAIVAFQQMIVLCDADGVVDMTPQAMAARTSIPLEIIQAGIEILEQPDPYTRTPGDDGRRILRLEAHRPWGWKIVNYLHYRYLVDAETVRAQNRERQRRHRDKSSRSVTDDNGVSRDVTNVTESNASSRHAEAEAEAERTPLPPEGEPRVEGLDEEAWKRFVSYRKQIRKTIKPASIPAAQRKLAGFGASQHAVVEQTIANGWTGLFELNVMQTNKPKQASEWM